MLNAKLGRKVHCLTDSKLILLAIIESGSRNIMCIDSQIMSSVFFLSLCSDPSIQESDVKTSHNSKQLTNPFSMLTFSMFCCVSLL
jgi:hypothetical protein